ncbi:hypothetical protein PIB30_038659 [Stylosanthes scabra]|uniref:Uncharacterized protein n=1 Tax=Stylosanthes scabra TaxID=79078 RepID=A0ABU6XD92_9FABA|nr:hypothetical protein [Stylosanthes scabra]
MLIEVTNTKEKDTGEIFDFYKEFDSDYKEEEVEEGKLAKGWGSDTETQSLQGEILSINTISDKKKDEKNSPSNVKTQAHACIVTAAGIIEDAIVKVGRLVIPTDFHLIQPPPGERGHDKSRPRRRKQG